MYDYKSISSFTFDPNDWSNMLELMDTYGDSEYPFHGKNADKEDILLNICHDHISVETFQSNGWVRITTYSREDLSVSETYERGDKV